MAEVSYPLASYNSGAVTEAEYARNMGYPQPSGLIGSPDDSSPVLLSGGSAYVRQGTAGRICGMAWEVQSANLLLTVGTNAAGSTRLDLVVARLTWATMQVRAAVLQGTPGAGAPTPTQQRGTGVYEVSLEQLSIPAGSGVSAATLTRRAWYLGKDGQILCKEASRPPHEMGRLIREVDNGRSLVSDGTAWITLLEDSGWTSLTPASGWTNTGGLRAYRRNGMVTLMVAPMRVGSSLGPNVASLITTLPVGYRPSQEVGIHTITDGFNVAYIDVGSTGAVTLRYHQGHPGGTYLVTNTVTYPAEG